MWSPPSSRGAPEAAAAAQRVHRLFCDGPLAPGATVTLTERAARHAIALRLRSGDPVTLFNGDGTESAAALVAVGKRGVTAAVRTRTAVDRESPLETRLIQGVCAADRMDLVLQKATELGVASIRPVVTARSVVRLASERLERREAHWRNVVIAACEQCGRNRIPQLAGTVPFAQFMADAPRAGTRLLLAPAAGARLRDIAPAPPVHVLIGPEGGLALEERTLVLAAGFVPVRFGPRTLRTETAPLAALAALQALWGDC
ncbi:MAG: 16S rRNA (uracil(1498)-N(3))-methyltransferase [Burkholderiales bacterium]|nr:16S rRNA (uracil(1498)-N(3))-methyltransferase [Burkholderiales bacterium]